MNHSTKKAQHEQARKKRKQDALDHARELQRRGRSKLPIWFLVGGIVVIVACVAMISFR